MLRHRKTATSSAAALTLSAALLTPGVSAASSPGPVSDAARPAGPSGVAVPGRSDGSWRLVFTDDFAGTALNTASWGVYHGNRAPQYWNASQVTVSDGAVHLRAEAGPDGHWVTGAITNARAVRQTYGKYLIRGRFGAGAGVRALELLWPAGGHAPPEIDFLEINGTDPLRLRATQTVHYGTSYHTDHGVIQTAYPAPAGSSFADWHTIGVEWSPGRIAYTCDGVIERVVTEQVPVEPMWLGLAEGQGTIKPTGTTPVDFDVDWVAIYAYDA